MPRTVSIEDRLTGHVSPVPPGHLWTTGINRLPTPRMAAEGAAPEMAGFAYRTTTSLVVSDEVWDFGGVPDERAVAMSG